MDGATQQSKLKLEKYMLRKLSRIVQRNARASGKLSAIQTPFALSAATGVNFQSKGQTRRQAQGERLIVYRLAALRSGSILVLIRTKCPPTGYHPPYSVNAAQ